MPKENTEHDGEKFGTVIIRCRFPRDKIRRINRVAKLRGIDRSYLLRSWIELIAEDELIAAEEEHGTKE